MKLFEEIKTSDSGIYQLFETGKTYKAIIVDKHGFKDEIRHRNLGAALKHRRRQFFLKMKSYDDAELA